MKKNEHFEALVARVPEDIKRELDYSFSISNSLDSLLKSKGLTQKQFAIMMGNKESEVSRWLSGSHNFTIRTIAKIETTLGERLIHL